MKRKPYWDGRVRRKFGFGETVDGEITGYREVFLADIVGVVLSERSVNDPHIVFDIICEDDDYWFPIYRSSGSYSTAWITAYEAVFHAAHAWCKRHALRDPSGYGYVFDDEVYIKSDCGRITMLKEKQRGKK